MLKLDILKPCRRSCQLSSCASPRQYSRRSSCKQPEAGPPTHLAEPMAFAQPQPANSSNNLNSSHASVEAKACQASLPAAAAPSLMVLHAQRSGTCACWLLVRTKASIAGTRASQFMQSAWESDCIKSSLLSGLLHLVLANNSSTNFYRSDRRLSNCRFASHCNTRSTSNLKLILINRAPNPWPCLPRVCARPVRRNLCFRPLQPPGTRGRAHWRRPPECEKGSETVPVRARLVYTHGAGSRRALACLQFRAPCAGTQMLPARRLSRARS